MRCCGGLCAREDVAELRDEGRSRHHLIDSSSTRRLDGGRVDMGNVAEGLRGAEAGVTLERHDGVEWTEAGAVQIEDHERRTLLADRVKELVAGTLEIDVGLQ